MNPAGLLWVAALALIWGRGFLLIRFSLRAVLFGGAAAAKRGHAPPGIVGILVERVLGRS